jgi:xylan 1,4-beta-xylosidase
MLITIVIKKRYYSVFAGCFALAVCALALDNGDGTYSNPMIHADYPDCEVIRVDSDYYYLASSFHWVPGNPLFHSRDLVNWKPVGFTLDPYGNAVLYLNPNLHYVANVTNSQFPIIARSQKPDLPVHITEWSASYSPHDPIHDSYFSAPFILEQLRHTERAASMSYWTFTDIFEENGPVPRPFHGGFGLINFQDIKKPAFWAYDFLSKLGATEIQNADSSSYVCVDDKGSTQVLLWDLTDLSSRGKISNQDIFFKPQPAKPKGNVTVNLTGLSPGNYQFSTYEIGYQKNDPYSRYLELGSPIDLTPKAVAGLKALSQGIPRRGLP